jgi:radical SAM protein with 4Fe4S-binding SPASM domain
MKMVDECAGRGDFLFFPQGFGESMLHPQWKEMLAYAKKKGVQPITLITNGTLLNHDKADHILDLKIDSMCFSVDGVTNETYSKVRVKGNLDKVVANVRNLIAKRNARGQREPAILMRIIQMPQTEEEVDAFLEQWRRNLGPQDAVAVNPYISWAGLMDEKQDNGAAKPSPIGKRWPEGPDEGSAPASSEPVDAPAVDETSRRPCRMLWKNFSILYDGRVSACCKDAEAELIIGDVRQNSIKEIWSGPVIKRLREMHKNGEWREIPICARCREWI